jgi:hypothetical protein
MGKFVRATFVQQTPEPSGSKIKEAGVYSKNFT